MDEEDPNTQFNSLRELLGDDSQHDSRELSTFSQVGENLQTARSPSSAHSTSARSTTGQESRGRRRRTPRAAKACLACHKRKVRCDAEAHGYPCSNCRLDLVDCTVQQPRGRKPRVKHQPGSTGRYSGGQPLANEDSPMEDATNTIIAIPTTTSARNALDTTLRNGMQRSAQDALPTNGENPSWQQCRCIVASLFVEISELLKPDRLPALEVALQRYYREIDRGKARMDDEMVPDLVATVLQIEKALSTVRNADAALGVIEQSLYNKHVVERIDEETNDSVNDSVSSRAYSPAQQEQQEYYSIGYTSCELISPNAPADSACWADDITFRTEEEFPKSTEEEFTWDDFLQRESSPV